MSSKLALLLSASERLESKLLNNKNNASCSAEESSSSAWFYPPQPPSNRTSAAGSTESLPQQQHHHTRKNLETLIAEIEQSQDLGRLMETNRILESQITELSKCLAAERLENHKLKLYLGAGTDHQSQIDNLHETISVLKCKIESLQQVQTIQENFISSHISTSSSSSSSSSDLKHQIIHIDRNSINTPSSSTATSNMHQKDSLILLVDKWRQLYFNLLLQSKINGKQVSKEKKQFESKISQLELTINHQKMDIESKQVLLSASTAELDFSNQQLDKSRKSLVEKTLQLQTEMKQRKDWVNMLSSTLPIVSGRMIEFQHEAQTRLQQFQNRIDYAARRIEGLSTAAADDAAKANESLPLHHHHHHQQQQPPPHAQTRMLNDVNKLLSLSTSLLLD